MGNLAENNSQIGNDDGPENSPTGLGFKKPKPTGIIRVSKKSAFIGMMILLAAVCVIMYGINNRKPSVNVQSASTENSKLFPAEQAGQEITRHIQKGSQPILNTPIPANNALLEPATPIQLEGPQLAQASSQHDLSGRTNAMPDKEMERVQRLREEREENLKKAMQSPIEAAGTGQASGKAGSFGGAAQNNVGPGGALQALQAMAGAGGFPAGNTGLTGAGGLGALGAISNSGLGGREEDQNMQAQKQQFVRNMEVLPDNNHIKSTRKGQLTPFEVKAGWIIPAVMEHGINSDLPGGLTARVNQNVYDTATGRHLLIPQGSQLVGAYDSQVAYGQNGLLVAWKRIVFPDGSSINLEGMGGTDAAGYSGFRDKVNNHYGRIIGFGLLTSLFSAAFQISQDNDRSVNGAQTAGQTAGSAVAQQMSQLGIEIARKNLRIQPTIEIRPGYQFNVRVDRDLLFSRPYVYGNAR